MACAGKKKNAYTLAKPVAPNTVLRDTNKKQWFVGEPIGRGGFGCIYSAKAEGDKKHSYVVKIEPKENGPLFTEIHFYIRVCLQKQIESWRMRQSLQHLGIPQYLGSGLMTHVDQSSCRFLIMDRFTSDFENLLKTCQVSLSDIFKVALQVVNALEYLHSNDYAHADIKASNLLYMGTLDRVYLVDFGLVSLFRKDGIHCAAKPDPKLKHNGTLEFCSRDAHTGLRPSRRSDLECLAFNLVHWLACCHAGAAQTHTTGLPWASLVPNNRSYANVPIRVKEAVAAAKQTAMQNPSQLIGFTGLVNTAGMLDCLESIARLGYDETPDYTRLQATLDSVCRLNLVSMTTTTVKTAKTKKWTASRDAGLSSPAAKLSAKRSVRPSPDPGPTMSKTRSPAVPANVIRGKQRPPTAPKETETKTVQSPHPPTHRPAVRPLRLHNDKAPAPGDRFRTSPLVAYKLRSPASPLSDRRRAVPSTSLSDLFSSPDEEDKPPVVAPRLSPVAFKSNGPVSGRRSSKSSQRRSACCQTSPELLALARREAALRRQKQRRAARE